MAFGLVFWIISVFLMFGFLFVSSKEFTTLSDWENETPTKREDALTNLVTYFIIWLIVEGVMGLVFINQMIEILSRLINTSGNL